MKEISHAISEIFLFLVPNYRDIFNRERASKSYSVEAYWLSLSISTVPMNAISVFIFTVVYYFLVGFRTGVCVWVCVEEGKREERRDERRQ